MSTNWEREQIVHLKSEPKRGWLAGWMLGFNPRGNQWWRSKNWSQIYLFKRKKECMWPQNWCIYHSVAAFSRSSNVVNFSLGLLLKFPSLLSSESIFSQALNGTTLTPLLSSNWSSPCRPGFGKVDADAISPWWTSSDILATYRAAGLVIQARLLNNENELGCKSNLLFLQHSRDL